MTHPTDHLREQLQLTLGASYTLEHELSGGGMSRVFVAEETTLGRRVVVKVLPPEMSGLVSVERFRREVQLAARLQHPHIVPLLSAGESGGLLYYTMPLVGGETLRARLSRDGALPLPIAIRIIRDVTKALAHAHRHSIVHRDIKPENVLLGEDDDAFVADFGIAKALAAATAIAPSGPRDGGGLTSVGVAVGTPAYMAPEQALADPQSDHRADLYALGIVAYEMIAGSHPFGGRTLQAVVAAHATEVPESLVRRRPIVPAELAALVMRLLEKNAADRPQSAGDVLLALDVVATPVALADPRANPAGPARRFRHRTLTLAVGGLVAVASLAAYGVWRGRVDTTRVATSPGSVRDAPMPETRPSVAVLAFANTSGNSADEPFSDGLTDDLIGALGKVGGLRVAGRTSAFALKGKGLGLRAVAETLGVAHVLEGSVRRAGDRFRVTATLVSAADGNVVWTNTYDRVLKDVFAVQEEIARAIVDSLRVKLAVGGENPRLVKVPTANLAAYDLYLKGQYFLNGSSRLDLLQALSYFEQATTLDPTYARAYAAMSHAHAYLAIFGFGNPHQEFARAKAAARKALELDSSLAEAHAALAHILFVYDWNWEAAEREFRLAITLDPTNPSARFAFAVCLNDQGRFAEALFELQQAMATDPLNGGSRNLMGRVLINARQPDRAIPYLLDAIKFSQRLDLAYQQLGHAYLMKGKYPEAILALRRAAELSGVRDSAQLAYAYAIVGQRGTAERIVRDLIESGKRRDLPPFHIAMAYAGLGDADEVFRWLERAFEQRGSFMDGVAVTAAFDPFHSDPRWARLLERMGLQS